MSGFGLGNPWCGAPMNLNLSPMGREAPCSKALPGTQSGDLFNFAVVQDHRSGAKVNIVSPHKTPLTDVYSTCSHDCQKWEATKMCIGRRMNEQSLHPCNGVSFGKRKE